MPCSRLARGDPKVGRAPPSIADGEGEEDEGGASGWLARRFPLPPSQPFFCTRRAAAARDPM
eukprot:2646519-Alexandrium_andersonii.AAC.1